MSIELKQAAQQALEALEFSETEPHRPQYEVEASAMRALRTAIQQAESEPVAYVCPTSRHAHDGSMEDGPDYLEWADEASDYEKRVGTPLYTHPAPGVPDDVVRDAERYRWLRKSLPAGQGSLTVLLDDRCNGAFHKAVFMESLDASIDAAMTAAQAQKGQP